MCVCVCVYIYIYVKMMLPILAIICALYMAHKRDNIAMAVFSQKSIMIVVKYVMNKVLFIQHIIKKVCFYFSLRLYYDIYDNDLLYN